jgi:predicted neuraminidase
VPYAGKVRPDRPQLAWRAGGEPHWNPVLFHDDARRRVLLFFKVGWSIERWETFVSESLDDGGTWREPRELVPGDHGGRGPVKNKLTVLADGNSSTPPHCSWVRGIVTHQPALRLSEPVCGTCFTLQQQHLGRVTDGGTGTWLAPASLEEGTWRAFVDRSSDGGATWQRSADVVATPQGTLREEGPTGN